MDQVTLAAEKREVFGSRPARRLRRSGRVPAVVYGRSAHTAEVSVDALELSRALHTEAGLNALLSIELPGIEPVLTVAREIQRDPVRGDITHLDFIQVSLDEAIQAEVTVDYQGVPLGVREDGAIVETIENTVLIEALPTQIPSSIEVDISHMVIGDTLKLAELPVIEGVTYVDDPDRPLLGVQAPRAEEEEVPVEELEGEELEAVEGEEGEAPAEAAEGGDEGDEG